MTSYPRKNGISGFTCPIPIQKYPTVLLAHGGGGKLMHQLINKMFLSTFGESSLEEVHDAAVLDIERSKIAFTTDSYVVSPLFFPGGDIGTLAVNGTVNDLAMCGASPHYLSTGFIIEEGLPMETLWRVVNSMKRSADDAGVAIVTGDTKVVDRGKGDGIFINTAGVGVVHHDLTISPTAVSPGDMIVLNGDLGRHGMAIMAVREGLEFDTTIESDCAPLSQLVDELIGADLEIHCMRDLTRGGLASALVEIAEASKTRLRVDETTLSVRDDVRGACEILGLDPLYVANEGRFVCFAPSEDAHRVLEIMKKHPLGRSANIIGAVEDGDGTLVTLKSHIGTTRIVDMLSGEQLPRIC
jgi:hydrogenase expression/formation protein HypE